MTAAIKANNFADLRAQLDVATDEQLAATLADLAGRTGVIAEECRRFVKAEIEFRAAHAALVAGMAPTTRWEATR